MSLKQFVRAVRATKTASDERAVIQKESASIRTSFREHPTDHNSRRNNVAKLLYLSFLGIPTHFGQIECVKLLASPKFTDKRLGYLGTMLLLDEAQEVLTLVTNSLQNDLAHSNQFIVGLALCTLGNIAGQEMSRDLCSDVAKLLGSTNSYIRKKAALCAQRIVNKVPDLHEIFFEKVQVLLGDKHHGVLLCGVTLAMDLCREDPDSIALYRSMVPMLVKTLGNLVGSGFAPEHDVVGIADPFLQVKLIRFLAVLGAGDQATSEAVNDVLAQVASNTEASKNVGNAILYETVLAILELECDSGLRVLGVNILGKFLTNKDNNIRYVALNTLTKVIDVEPNAVQRHRSTILECLRDPDISIRRRALDLSFALINATNVRILIRELLAFLEVADNEFKLKMTTQIGIAADRFAPNTRWHIDTLIRALRLAGNYVREELLSAFIRLFALSSDLHAYTTNKLFTSLQADITQEGLILAAAWMVGEHGSVLWLGGKLEGEETLPTFQPETIVRLFESILTSTFASTIVSEYILTTLAKLSTRIDSDDLVCEIQDIMLKYSSDVNPELQQRAIEYANIKAHPEILHGVLERMPLPEIREEDRVLGPTSTPLKKARKQKSDMDDLLNLLGDDEEPPRSAQKQIDNTNLLQDIFADAQSSELSMARSLPVAHEVIDLASSLHQAQLTPTDLMTKSLVHDDPQKSTTLEVFHRDALQLSLQYSTDALATGNLSVQAKFHNSGSNVYNLVMQAAVPKSMKLQLQPLSASTIVTGEYAVQLMRVVASPKVTIKIRFKIQYDRQAGNTIVEVVDCTLR